MMLLFSITISSCLISFTFSAGFSSALFSITGSLLFTLSTFCSIMFSSLAGCCSIMMLLLFSTALSSCLISFSFSSAFSSLLIILLSLFIFSSDLLSSTLMRLLISFSFSLSFSELSSLMSGSLLILFISLISLLAAFNTDFLLLASVSMLIADSKRVLPISDQGLHCGSSGLPVKFLTPSLLFAAIYSFAVLAISPTSLSSSMGSYAGPSACVL